MTILLIDNYDSFTYNLLHYLAELGADVEVVRNDAMAAQDTVTHPSGGILLSPGPCTPDEAGICLEVVKEAAKAGKPLLGVCLGHQAIAQALGGRVVRASKPMHGKVCPVRHEGKGVFAGIPSPFEVTRYHSLVVDRESVPGSLEVTATLDMPDEPAEIMGLQHRELPIFGVQFHPESIASQHGHTLLKNFLEVL